MINFWQRRQRTYRVRGIGKSRVKTLNTSQAGVAGFDLDTYQAAHVVLIGAGGIGSHVATSLIRKGIGQLTILDDDRVELKNLTRQLFAHRDIGRFKAVALAETLAREALFPTEITAIPRRFGEALMHGWQPPQGAVLIAGIDNNPGRREITEYARDHGHAALHAAVSGDAQQLYVFIERPGEACWGCAFPHYLNDGRHPCGVPGIVDILQVVSGLMVFALDSLIATRSCDWNKRQLVLDGSMPDQCRHVARNPACPLCGPTSEHTNTVTACTHQPLDPGAITMSRKTSIRVLKPFTVGFERNETRIEAGTELRDAGGGYLGFYGDLQLLLDPDAVARLIAAGVIAADREADSADMLQAAE